MTVKIDKKDALLFIQQVKSTPSYGSMAEILGDDEVLAKKLVEDDEEEDLCNELRIVQWFETLLGNQETEKIAVSQELLSVAPLAVRVLFGLEIGIFSAEPYSTWEEWRRIREINHLCMDCHFPKLRLITACPVCGD